MSNLDKFLQWEATTRESIDFKTVYVDMAGDLIAGLLLSQIIYWHLPSKKGASKLRVNRNGQLWLAKRHDDWYDEIRISAAQARRGLDILKEKGIIETARFRFDGSPTTHIRICQDAFFKVWNAILDERKSNCAVEQNECAQTDDSLTEITSEITPDSPIGEATPKRRAPVDEKWSHPAILAVKAAKQSPRNPPTGAYNKIVRILGDHPDVDKLRLCWEEWCMRGNKTVSWKWLEDWYVKGIPNGNGANGGGVPEPAGMAGIREYRRQHNMVDTHGK